MGQVSTASHHEGTAATHQQRATCPLFRFIQLDTLSPHTLQQSATSISCLEPRGALAHCAIAPSHLAAKAPINYGPHPLSGCIPTEHGM